MRNFDITFKWVGAATWILTIDDLKIACDPALCPKGTLQDYRFFKAKRRTSPQYETRDFEEIDFWLLTHAHEDHIDAYGVTKIAPTTKIYANANLQRWLRLIYAQNVEYLKSGMKRIFQKYDLKVTIEAVPCVHASNFVAAWFAGSVNGYWLTIEKKQSVFSIYVTGDTVNHPSVRAFLKGRKVDMLIPNVGAGGLGKFGSPYTLDAKQLKAMARQLKPNLILPVHHTTFSIYKEPIEALYRLDGLNVLRFEEGQTFAIENTYDELSKMSIFRHLKPLS